MPTERDHLRDAVIRGVRDADAVFRRLAERVSEIVGRTPAPWNLLAKRKAMRLIDGVLDRVFGLTQRAALTSELFAVITRSTESTALGVFDRAVERVRDAVELVQPGWWQRIINRPTLDDFTSTAVDLGGSAVQRQRALRSRGFDSNRRWVDPKGYRLSDRIWKGGRSVRREIDRVLVDGIRNGESAVDVAAKLEQYLNPDKAPQSYRKDGKIVRKHMTRTPYGKAGSSYARSLARTEISRAHAVATLEAAKVTPGVVGVKWRLSNQHVGQDPCNDNAQRHSDGMEPGEYRVQEAPRMPQHPQCICCYLPVTVLRDAMLDDLVSRYGEP